MAHTPDEDQGLLQILGELYGQKGDRRYGLAELNQRMHAVQAAALAQAQGSSSAVVVAALLHDIGHMLHGLGEHPAARGVDDQHEQVGANWLAQYFGDEVVEPVRLHVAAKRYLCATDPGYLDKLSRDSLESLALQGGPMSAPEQQVFRSRLGWREAVALRRLDEQAKDPAGPAPAFSEFHQIILSHHRAFLSAA